MARTKKHEPAEMAFVASHYHASSVRRGQCWTDLYRCHECGYEADYSTNFVKKPLMCAGGKKPSRRMELDSK